MDKRRNSKEIEIEYPGSYITKNHYKYRGGIYTRKEARAWMQMLGWMVKPLHLEEWTLPISVTVSGRFKDKRSIPDLVNLQNCILDAIQDATGVNDRNMRWRDGKVEIGEPPMLFIKLEETK